MPTTYLRPSRSLSHLPGSVRVLVLARGAVGLGGWLTPAATWRLAGLGPLPDRGSTVVVARLFAVRDLAMAAAVAQPDPALRRAALRAGVLIDTVDTVAGLLGPRGGAPRASLVGVAAGAALLAGLGLAALQQEVG